MAAAPSDPSCNALAMTHEKQFSSLAEDVQELILLHLPVSTAVRAASVSKHWHTLISSPSFTSQQSRLSVGKRPWFFLLGINELIHSRSQAFAFDPEAGSWISLRLSRPPDFNRASLSGMDGLLFASSGSKMCYVSAPMKMKWKETSSLSSTRCSALMGVVGNPESDLFKFIVVGGMLDGDERMVEMYDSSMDAWEVCPPLREGFKEGKFSHWMSSAVCGHKFYVSENHSGDIAAFDVQEKLWSRVETLNLPGMVYFFIVACQDGLFAAGVCDGYDGKCFKLWKVDEQTMECEEVSRMPQDLFSLFENEDEEKEASLKCVGSGDLIYAYSDSFYKGYPVCVCELSEGRYRWKQLPSLPSPLPHFARLVCCSTTVTPSACLGSC